MNLTYLHMHTRARDQSNNETQYIDYESLPMLRRLFFWGGITVIFAVMATITQVLLYLWLVAGAIGMWSALCPVIIMIVLLLCYMFILKTISIETCLLCSLLFLVMVGKNNCIPKVIHFSMESLVNRL